MIQTTYFVLNSSLGILVWNICLGYKFIISTWDDKLSFENWTRSESFRKAHAGASDRKNLYIGHPDFEGFEVVL